MRSFTQITVQNFFSFAKEQTLDLTGDGLVNLSAPNGYGKSALLIESFTFALYGRTRQAKIDDVVNRYTGKNCKVSVSFVGDDGELYKVIRYRNHDTHKNNIYLFRGDKDISSKNVKDTDQQIQDLAGMPYIAFVNSTIFSSELYSNFFSAKNSDRLAIFENILSLKEVTAFYLETKEILKELAEKENDQRLIYSQLESSVQAAENSLKEYTVQAKEKLLSLKKEKEELKTETAENERKLLELSTVDVQSEKEKLKSGELKRECRKKISEKESQIKELAVPDVSAKTMEIAERYRGFDFEANRKKEKEWNEAAERKRKLSEQMADISFSIKSSENKILSNRKEIEHSETEMKKQQADLEKIAESICPFCGQKMGTEETERKRKAAEEAIESESNRIKELSEENKKLEESKEISRQVLAGLQEQLESLDIPENFEKNTDLLLEQYSNAVKEIEENRKKKEINGKIASRLEDEIRELERKAEGLAESSYTTEELDNLESSVKALKDNIAESEKRLAAIDGSVASTYDKGFVESQKKSIAEKTEEMKRAKEVFGETESDRRHYEYLAECFSNKSGGFKKYFIGEMIPVFIQKLNQYLPFFFNDREVEIQFDRDLNDQIIVDGRQVAFASFSRGQKTRLEISAALALFGMSRIFFSNESGLLVIDEILDQGLDLYGTKAAIEILKGFAEDSKIFVVSHNQETKDLMDESMELRLDENGFSYIA